MKKILTISLFVFIFIVIGYLSPVTAAASWSSPMGITTRHDGVDYSPTLGPDRWATIENRIKLTVEAGASWDRLFMPSQYIITSTGEINNDYLTKLDRLITLYKKYHLNAYMMLFNSSEFIGYEGDPCTREDIPNPIDWPYDLWHSPPGNQVKWIEYISTLVNRYKNDIKYWEISFEQNNPGCQFLLFPDRYVAFLKDASTTIRNIDPTAKIILGRLLPLNNTSYFATLLEKGAGSYFDVVSVGGPYQCTRADNAATWITRIKEIMIQHNMKKPIWLTEVFCASDADGNGESDNAGHELQKTFIKEIYKQSLAAGAQKVFLNSLVDRNNFIRVEKRMNGIVSRQGTTLTKKPSFSAYQQAAEAAGFPAPTPTPIPADLNQDGKVDIYDYNILVADFGKTGTPGWIKADINKNGRVDIYDYNTLVGNFGRS